MSQVVTNRSRQHVCPAGFSAMPERLQPGRASSAQPRNLRRHHETGLDRRLGHCRRNRTGPCRLLRDQFREQSGQPGSSSAASANSPVQSQAGSQPAAQGQAAGSGSLTPPGAHLAFGGPATVGWVPPSQDTGTGAHHGIRLRVSVVSIQKGTMADFRNVQLNGNERKSTPYYVQLRVTALSSTAPPKAAANEVTPYFDRPIVWG